MKFSSFIVAAAIATEACGATPHIIQESNVRVAPSRRPSELIQASEEMREENSQGGKTSEQKSQKPKTYEWGKDSDEDQKRIEELSELIAAFAVERYAECVQDAFEKETETNSDADFSHNCLLTVEDDDTKEVLKEDIPGNIQREILGKVRILLDDFKAREEAQRAKTHEAFEKLKDAINNTLAP